MGGVPTKVVCAECMKMCCLGGKNSVVKGLNYSPPIVSACIRGVPQYTEILTTNNLEIENVPWHTMLKVPKKLLCRACCVAYVCVWYL